MILTFSILYQGSLLDAAAFFADERQFLVHFLILGQQFVHHLLLLSHAQFSSPSFFIVSDNIL